MPKKTKSPALRRTASPTRGARAEICPEPAAADRTAGRSTCRPPRRAPAAKIKLSAAAAHTEALVVSAAQPPAVSDVEPPVVSAVEPRTHRELAEAIFSECDPVKIGRELLASSSDKGASVRARVFETLANWQFGKPAATAARHGGMRVIWDIPGPPRESEDPK